MTGLGKTEPFGCQRIIPLKSVMQRTSRILCIIQNLFMSDSMSEPRAKSINAFACNLSRDLDPGS